MKSTLHTPFSCMICFACLRASFLGPVAALGLTHVLLSRVCAGACGGSVARAGLPRAVARERRVGRGQGPTAGRAGAPRHAQQQYGSCIVNPACTLLLCRPRLLAVLFAVEAPVGTSALDACSQR
eukprot:3951067-Pleurochrysis_carterae.AAC.2